MLRVSKQTGNKLFNINRPEQPCMLADGPCADTGDSMQQVHTGINIGETEFNHGVVLFVYTMDEADAPRNMQNRLLREIAKTRDQMIYRQEHSTS